MVQPRAEQEEAGAVMEVEVEARVAEYPQQAFHSTPVEWHEHKVYPFQEVEQGAEMDMAC